MGEGRLTDSLLLFLGPDGGIDHWLLLAGGIVASRGMELPEMMGAAQLVAVVPGDEVVLHWLDLPAGLAPAQASAAARLIAADFSAQPISDMHVAVGSPKGAGEYRCVALAPMAVMTGWMSKLQAQGLDVDLVIPETLLILPPGEGLVRVDRADAPSLYRAQSEAFAAEPDLAGLILAGREAAPLAQETFEAQMAEAIASPAVNLRQGPFARRREWKADAKLVRRLALLGLAILIVTLFIQIAAIARYTFAADALEAETKRVASNALPRTAGVGDPSGEIGRRLAQLRGGGVGWSGIAGPVFAAVRATANSELASLTFSSDGRLRISVQADSPATIEQLGTRIEEAGFEVDQGPPRSGGGRPIADLTVRPR